MKKPAADGLIDFNFASFTSSGATASQDLDQTHLSTYLISFKNQLTLSNVPTNSIVSVYSISESKLLETKKGNISSFRLNTSTLTTGIYMVRVTSNNAATKTIKVFKK